MPISSDGCSGWAEFDEKDSSRPSVLASYAADGAGVARSCGKKTPGWRLAA